MRYLFLSSWSIKTAKSYAPISTVDIEPQLDHHFKKGYDSKHICKAVKHTAYLGKYFPEVCGFFILRGRLFHLSFQASYECWLEIHLKERKGESKRRLEQGHGYAEKLFLEKVWYPAFQELDGLYPEYEVADFRGGTRYLDFAIRKPACNSS